MKHDVSETTQNRHDPGAEQAEYSDLDQAKALEPVSNLPLYLRQVTGRLPLQRRVR